MYGKFQENFGKTNADTASIAPSTATVQVNQLPPFPIFYQQQIIREQAEIDAPRMAVNLDRNFINGRALHLLLQISIFTAHPGVRFDNWIRHLDNVLEPTNWRDAEKIRALTDRLQGSAHDIMQSIRADGGTYAQIKDKLKKRYHDHETSAYYQKEFEERVRKPAETISDYSYCMNNLLVQAYLHLNTEEFRFPFLKRAFLRGISAQLRAALQNINS